MDLRAVAKLLDPLARRIKLLLSYGVVKRVDAAKAQAVQVVAYAGETLNGVRHWEPYGYTSYPLTDAEVLLGSLGGRRTHAEALCVADRRHRKQDLTAGEVALYTDEGDSVVLKRGRIVAVNAGTRVHVSAPDVLADCDTATVNAATSVTLATPQATVTGQLTVQGLIVGQGGMAISGGTGTTVDGSMAVSGGDVSADGISLKGHTHEGDSGGSTGVAR